MWLHMPTEGQKTDDQTITIADFCAGSGMLAEAVSAALELRGIRSACLVHVEREAVTAAVLVALQTAAGNEAPVWDDLATFDGRPWRGIVDIAVAGLPCPAYSVAGQRRGNDDERAWGEGFDPDDLATWGPVPHFLRIIAEMRPAVVFCENVPPWVLAGHFRRFGEELSGLGYRIEDPLFLAAEDVGAPHRRERVFIMANREGAIWQRHNAPGAQRWRADYACRGSEELAHGGGARRQGNRPERAARGGHEQSAELDRELGDSQRPESRPGDGGIESNPSEYGRDRLADRGGELGDTADAIGRGRDDGTRTGQATNEGRPELPFFPPGRNDYGAWASAIGLYPTCAPAIESGVPVVADGLAVANADLLRIGGNGVCTLAAAVAFGTLWDRAIATQIAAAIERGGKDNQ
jgi:DNA (cytosine-5)-methyltransferase 1